MSANTAHLQISRVQELVNRMTPPPIPTSSEVVESHVLSNVTLLIKSLLAGSKYSKGSDKHIDLLHEVRPYDEDYVHMAQHMGCIFIPKEDQTSLAVILNGTFLFETSPNLAEASKKVCKEKGWYPKPRFATEYWTVTEQLAKALHQCGGTISTMLSGKETPIWHRELTIPFNQDPIFQKAQAIFET